MGAAPATKIANPKFDQQKRAWINQLASSDLARLREQYLWSLEEVGASAPPEANAAGREMAALVEAIAIFRFGSQWVRP